jgi:MFS family permease
MIDKVGRNVTWVFVSCVGTLVGHVMLALTFWNPYVAISIMGISYSLLASSLWPIAAFMVDEKVLGSAYGMTQITTFVRRAQNKLFFAIAGLMQSIQNLGLVIVPMLSGTIADRIGYLCLELQFAAWVLIALALTVWIWIIDMVRT